MRADELRADYVVVGAGSAGCVLARRLVDTGASVLLLEAGGTDGNPAIHDPLRMHELWHSVQDWDYATVPQRHAAGRRLHLPRGRVLGGSHALNATIYVRGDPSDYDGWAALGNPGWSWQQVRPFFERIERSLDVLRQVEPDPVQRAIVAAAQESGIGFNPDYNSGKQDGVSHVQLTIAGGVRRTTAAAYLRSVVDRDGLTVVLGSTARRLLVSRGRAHGVEFLRGGGLVRARADREVVLACGAIGSPALLLRSGIGNPRELSGAGVPAVMDLPGVGRNLRDHWLSPVVFSTARAVEHTPGLPHSQTHAFLRSDPALPVPDLQPLHFSVPLCEPWMTPPEQGFSLMAGLIRPESVGGLTITGPEPSDRTLIDPAVFSAPSDLTRLATAVRRCEEIGAAPALRAWGAEQRYPQPELDDAALHDYLRRTVVTYHHQCGTCRMGVDGSAVVDPELRVHGIDGLRVADASIMPTITNGNTNAPTIMIAEKAAAMLAGTAEPAAATHAAGAGTAHAGLPSG